MYVKAFFHITIPLILFDFWLKRELDIKVAAVLIRNSVAHDPNNYVLGQLEQQLKIKEIVHLLHGPYDKNVFIFGLTVGEKAFIFMIAKSSRASASVKHLI